MGSSSGMGAGDTGTQDADSGSFIAAHPPIPDAALVRRTLREILQSAPFRSSKQCQELFLYIVQHSLAGEDNLLRERVIGTEVFGRTPDYDTANDPVVRARVAEVRKRLAQYYVAAAQKDIALHIEIPHGSYRAHFEIHSKPAAAPPPPPPPPPPLELNHDGDKAESPAPHSDSAIAPPVARSRRFNWPASIAAAVLLLACAVWLMVHSFYSFEERALRRFWGPAMETHSPILIYTGTNVIYRFTPEFLSKYRAAHHQEDTGPEFVVDLKSLPKLDPHDIESSKNTYVTVGDISACADLVAMLARRGRTYELRYAEDISSGDLRSQPTVLIGAFNNNFTLNVTSPLRFAFVHGNTIVDHQDKSRSWTVHVNPDGSTTDDYAIVTRLLNAQSSGILLTASGIGQYGTQAASEMLSNPQRIANFVRKAPRDWDKKNIQIVLHIKVADELPTAVEVVAVHYWNVN